MAPNDLTPCRMAFYFVSTFAIAQTPTKQPALRLSRTKNLHFAKAPFPGFSANEVENYLEGRVRDVIMFPGAAYDCLSKVTGLRGKVERNDRPMRWAYIEARDIVSNSIVARARGDDRGEFLFILPSLAAQASELNSTLDVRVSIAGPELEAVTGSPDLMANDRYWDLPLEELPSLGEVDNVSSGESFPTGFVTALSAVRIVSFQLGRLLTGREIADFDFSFP